MSISDDQLRECQTILRHDYANVELLRKALVHASAASTRIESNERLEFLGDAVFGAIVCEELFNRYPDKTEGELTRIKSAVVSRSACARVINDLDLGRFIILGKGVASRSGRIPGSILAAAIESIIASIYLDAGYQAACEFVVRVFDTEIQTVADGESGENYKSWLQQHAQRVFSETPSYAILDEQGPDHQKSFQIAATLAGTQYEPAWGRNKKEAEQKAARNALDSLGVLSST